MCEPCNTAKSDDWDGESGLGIDDCNRRKMTIEEQAKSCLENAMDAVSVAVLGSRGTLSMPELVAIGMAAAIEAMPNGYVGNVELADKIRSDRSSADMFGAALYKNDIRISGE